MGKTRKNTGKKTERKMGKTWKNNGQKTYQRRILLRRGLLICPGLGILNCEGFLNSTQTLL